MQRLFRLFLPVVAILSFNSPVLFSQVGDPTLVTPNASPEARALLQYFYSISGRYTLTGQHNYPGTNARNTEFAAKYIGKTPVVFTTDWGFAKAGDYDSYLSRPAIVEEVKRQHRLGSIISICWHAVPPTAVEPITFRPMPGSSSDSLASVQGQLLDRQFRDVLTPGTNLYKQWCAQVDSVAFYLKQLQGAHIPILWRPYHEMNGEWFWWGGRHGKYGTAALYRQLFDRFVKHHKLKNLIWEWSIDRPARPERQFTYYNPGSTYFDIVALDVYGSDFSQAYYDSLAILSQGKPMVLAEVGNPPSPAILSVQPRWAYYAIWAGMVRNTKMAEYAELMGSPRILCLEDSAYRIGIDNYRKICGLPPLPLLEIKRPIIKMDFSGTWMFNDESSVMQNTGSAYVPFKLRISQNDSCLVVERTTIVEFDDDRIETDTLILDGKEHSMRIFNRPRVTKVSWSPKNDSLIVESKVTFDGWGENNPVSINEFWTVKEQGNVLLIHQVSQSSVDKKDLTLVYDRKLPN